ncbi:hypothetical protein AUCHE_22_00880 [Austwickia chelonae NBRC 105200]|uniref:Uncharacterized protein n=1 Tax=Austwickia chelonae NBRC 105200 TaxID=1184607 RepID=K6VAP5_9MICO|nr:hypothetical protein AUCHE_22_00880 [Austwickia chelonae NBRC 105200]
MPTKRAGLHRTIHAEDGKVYELSAQNAFRTLLENPEMLRTELLSSATLGLLRPGRYLHRWTISLREIQGQEKGLLIKEQTTDRGRREALDILDRWQRQLGRTSRSE